MDNSLNEWMKNAQEQQSAKSQMHDGEFSMFMENFGNAYFESRLKDPKKYFTKNS